MTATSALDEPPQLDRGRTVAHDFPLDDGRTVRMLVRMRWENDPNCGVGTIWWAECVPVQHFTLDGEADGILTPRDILDRLAPYVTARMRDIDPDTPSNVT